MTRSLSFLFMATGFQQPPSPPQEGKGWIHFKTGADRGYFESRGLLNGAMPVLNDRLPEVFGSGVGPCGWDAERRAISFRFKIPSQQKLTTIAWSMDKGGSVHTPTHYLDWRWDPEAVKGKRDTVTEYSFFIEPAVSGTAEITLGIGVHSERVSFLPADAKGEIPDWSQTRVGATFEEPVSAEGKAVFKGMKPGRYVFYPTAEFLPTGQPGMTVSVEVKARETVKAVLGPGSK
jgi:hypothetical protein